MDESFYDFPGRCWVFESRRTDVPGSPWLLVDASCYGLDAARSLLEQLVSDQSPLVPVEFRIVPDIPF